MNKENYLTQKGLENLKQELQTLKTTTRKEIAERIRSAKEFGDLSENAEYQEAKNQQAFNEGRIADLDYMIKNVTVIQETVSNGIVNVGSKIKIRDGETVKEYKIVGCEEADPMGGLISHESPIGKAFIGKCVGEIVEIQVPRGTIKYEIIEIF